MRYKIVLKAMHNKKMLTLLSEKIAEKEHLPQTQIVRELAQGGYVYAADLLKAEAALTAQKLQKLHIEFAIIKEEESQPEKELFVPKDVKEEAPIPPSAPKPLTKSPQHIPQKQSSTHDHHIGDSQHEANLRALYGLDTVPKKEKVNPLLLLRNLLIVLLLFGLIWFIAQQTDTNSSRPKRGKIRSSSQTAAKQGKQTKGSSKTQNRKEQRPRNAEEAENTKEKADDLCGSDGDQATKLYRVALSFNKKNIDAWYGLLNCYKEHNMTKEIGETEAEMRKIFGPHIFSIHKMVSPYGALEEYTDSKAAAFLRYSSFQSDDPVLDIYKIALSVSNVCKGNKITIYATIGKEDGYLVSVKRKPFPRGFSAFKSEATIDKL